jgi:hypothetical protein
MGRLFGLALMVVALWAGSVVYLEGVEGLTGRFVSGGPSQDAGQEGSPHEVRSLPQRFGDVVDAEMHKREQRVADRLDDLDGV